MLCSTVAGGNEREESRMNFVLANGEPELLLRILHQYLSDLRMEIADTDDYDFRQGLKADEEHIKDMIARLERDGIRLAA